MNAPLQISLGGLDEGRPKDNLVPDVAGDKDDETDVGDEEI